MFRSQRSRSESRLRLLRDYQLESNASSTSCGATMNWSNHHALRSTSKRRRSYSRGSFCRSPSCKPLTKTLEGCFGGASATPCAQDWARNLSQRLSDQLRPDETSTVTFTHASPGVQIAQCLVLSPGTQTQGTMQVTLSDVLLRFVCGALIWHLPERAMPELCENLSDLYSHYANTPVQTSRPLLANTKQIAKRGKINPPAEIRIEG